MSKQNNHRWLLASAVIGDTPSGCQETHRRCAQCPVIKITVHPPHGFAYRVWETANGARWKGDHAPPCVPAAAPAEVPAL